MIQILSISILLGWKMWLFLFCIVILFFGLTFYTKKVYFKSPDEVIPSKKKTELLIFNVGFSIVGLIILKNYAELHIPYKGLVAIIIFFISSSIVTIVITELLVRLTSKKYKEYLTTLKKNK